MTTAFRRILVPIDFSAKTDDAVNAGNIKVGDVEIAIAPVSKRVLDLANKLVGEGGEIMLLHVTPALEQAGVYSGAAGMNLLAEALDEVHRNANDASVKVLDVLAERHFPGKVVRTCAKAGIAIRVILEQAEDYDADCIIVATSGRSRAARFFLGSTADRVIREALCPVIVLPSHEHSHSG